ncbi:MAG: TlyA family RNA methyltransferase [Coriobacteriales bacterium]|jgi:23S rRNA (cytidine1920-2'-O)/16S rRNA (cytidine1409-2'-O)-methyltransferase|nr:TlyA family RNA methyltransferase [Coriobacteriales bacterium]
MNKLRLDELLVKKGYYASIDDASRAIHAGKVRCGTDVLQHPAMRIATDADLAVIVEKRYVSRGGIKLEGALSDFDFDVSGLNCLDVGASTGGFTDCLLQHGAAHVTAVDVAYGQLAWQLRQDARVSVYERCNISKIELSKLGNTHFNLIVADVSFSPLSRLLPILQKFAGDLGHDAIADVVNRGVSAETLEHGVSADNVDACNNFDSFLIALCKPQFELPKSMVKDGVIIDAKAHEQALSQVLNAAQKSRWQPKMLSVSHLRGPKGNIEFFFLMQFVQTQGLDTAANHVNIDVSATVLDAHARFNNR